MSKATVNLAVLILPLHKEFLQCNCSLSTSADICSPACPPAQQLSVSAFSEFTSLVISNAVHVQRRPPWVLNILRVKDIWRNAFCGLKSSVFKNKMITQACFHAAGFVMHHTVTQGLSKYLSVDNYELLSPKDIGSVYAIGYGIMSLFENITVQSLTYQRSITYTMGT